MLNKAGATKLTLPCLQHVISHPLAHGKSRQIVAAFPGAAVTTRRKRAPGKVRQVKPYDTWNRYSPPGSSICSGLGGGAGCHSRALSTTWRIR